MKSIIKEFDVVENYREEIASAYRMIDLYKEAIKKEKANIRKYLRKITRYKKEMAKIGR